MKINTRSLHYRLYDYTYSSWGGASPIATNLCQYVRRLILSPFIILPVSAISFLALIFLAVRAFLTYPLGYSTNWKTLELRGRSPGMFQVAGLQVYSGYFVIPIALVIGNFLAYGQLFIHGVKPGVGSTLSIMLIITEVSVLIFGLIAGMIIFFSSDTYDLFSEWIDAKTEGVCPLIEFDEDDDQ